MNTRNVVVDSKLVESVEVQVAHPNVSHGIAEHQLDKFHPNKNYLL